MLDLKYPVSLLPSSALKDRWFDRFKSFKNSSGFSGRLLDVSKIAEMRNAIDRLSGSQEK